jgi:excisionase family DNA binding protein
MRQLMGAKRPATDERKFRSVPEAARVFGVSEMTLYRAIHSRQFPAVRIMGRLVVPLRAIDAMESEAVERGELVDAADWVQPEPDFDDASPPAGHVMGRPRPGANQTGAGSFSTQHAAGYGEDPTPGRRGRRRGGVA